jgi:hypothetical protein
MYENGKMKPAQIVLRRGEEGIREGKKKKKKRVRMTLTASRIVFFFLRLDLAM